MSAYRSNLFKSRIMVKWNYGEHWVGKYGYMNLLEAERNRNISYWRSGGQDVKIRWKDKLYTDAPTYYREVVLSMPEVDGVIVGADTHLTMLGRLSNVGIYVTDQDASDIYVDGWRVNGSYLTHKHPEFGTITTEWSSGLVEADVLPSGLCDLCEKKIPGEIEMMHNFYRLDG